MFSLCCPRLVELPSPSKGRVGWPWTEDSALLPASMPDGRPWPSISIVTPSYNQGRFLEETIRSVLLQGYPNLEYSVVDGGSSDCSVDIIHKYERWLTRWVSERDYGQGDALRKGFRSSNGCLFGWINSDDLLAPGALEAVAFAAALHPEYGIYAGTVEDFNSDSFGADHKIVRQQNISLVNLILPDPRRRAIYHQPGIFFTSRLYRASGGINPRYYYRMDYDLLLRMLDNGGRLWYLGKTLAYFRIHPISKTGASHGKLATLSDTEGYEIARRYAGRLSEGDRKKLRLQYLQDLVHGAYLGFMEGHLEGAGSSIRLAVREGRLDVLRAFTRFIARGILTRLENSLQSSESTTS